MRHAGRGVAAEYASADECSHLTRKLAMSLLSRSIAGLVAVTFSAMNAAAQSFVKVAPGVSLACRRRRRDATG